MTIKCPFCAEEIQEDALKCRYCKEWINQPEAIAKAPDIHVETKTDPTTLAERADTAAIDPTAGTVPLDTQEPPADPAKASTSGNSDSHYRRNEKNKFDTVNLRFNGDTSSMDRDDKSKLHRQPWFTALMLVFCSPIGLVLMWLYQTKWNVTVKSVITAAISVLLIISIATNGTPTDQPTPPATETNAAPAADPNPSPPPAALIAQAKQEEAKGFGLSYDQITNNISDKMDFSDGEPVDGRRNTLGRYGPHGALIQIIGDHDNVWEASITVSEAELTNDDSDPSTSAVANGALSLVFFANLTPRWPNGQQWLVDAIGRAENNPDTLIRSKAHARIRYTVKYDSTLQMMMIVAKRADNPDD